MPFACQTDKQKATSHLPPVRKMGRIAGGGGGGYQYFAVLEAVRDAPRKAGAACAQMVHITNKVNELTAKDEVASGKAPTVRCSGVVDPCLKKLRDRYGLVTKFQKDALWELTVRA